MGASRNVKVLTGSNNTVKDSGEQLQDAGPNGAAI